MTRTGRPPVGKSEGDRFPHQRDDQLAAVATAAPAVTAPVGDGGTSEVRSSD